MAGLAEAAIAMFIVLAIRHGKAHSTLAIEGELVQEDAAMVLFEDHTVIYTINR